MTTEILISSDPWENRVAILEDGKLAELYIEREERVIGSIYKGKVHNVLPGMGAAFVDIGVGRNAFLYVDDINKQPLNIGDVEITQGRSGFTITEKIKKGDEVLVQIVKEPRGVKGARVSTNISLPGRYLILMPTGRYSGVSRKIESPEERNRLKAIMKRIRPEGMATVVRTAAAGVSEAELIADLGVLIRMWHGILELYKRAKAPALLHKDMNLIYKAARDFITADVDRVLVDDEEEFRKIREFLQLLGPQYLDRITLYERGRSLFVDYRIEEELQRLMRPKINLPSGGSIVIESTEALTVIDVNSGKFTGGKNLEDTIVKTNLEAAAEIARQVRLRDIGGIIVVDFIDMASDASRQKVIKALEEGLRRDRTRSTIQSFSALGLLEFTRKRIGKDLAAQLRDECPICEGLGSVLSAQSVAIETLRRLRDERCAHGEEVTVVAPPAVAAQLAFWYAEECTRLAETFGGKIRIRVDGHAHPEQARIVHRAVTSEVPAVRVGDEREVELLPVRLPNPGSAAAVVGDRIVEIENATPGAHVKIRILDVDDESDTVLAEVVTTAATAGKRRRRKKKTTLTAAEEAAQLRALAEEAARQAQARPPIGISAAPEEEEEAVERTARLEAKAEQTPEAIVIPGASADAGESGGRRRRRRRRRRRGGASAEQPLSVAQQPAVAASSGEAEEADRAVPAPAVAGDQAAEDGHRRRRRRRRRRGRGRSTAEGMLPEQAPIPERQILRVGADGTAEVTGQTAPPEPVRAIAPRPVAAPPAVEPPPPSLTAPAEEPRVAKPTRRRAARKPIGELEAAPLPALPVPADGKRRSRLSKARAEQSPAEQAESAAHEAPKKRTRRTATAATKQRTEAAEPAASPALEEPGDAPTSRRRRSRATTATGAATTTTRTRRKKRE